MNRFKTFLAVAMLTASTLTAALPEGLVRDGINWTLPWGDSTLEGILVEPTDGSSSPHPAVLLSHGLGGTGPGLIGRAKQFADAGYVAIAVSYAHAGPGQMRNPDNAASPENFRRAQACLDIVSALSNVDPHRLYAWGFSMGAILTVGVTAEYPDRLAAAVIMAGGVQENPERLYISAERARRIRTPILILHGDADPRVLPEWSALLADTLQAVGTPFERYTYPGVDHPGILQVDDANARILPWFARFPSSLRAPPATAAAPTPPPAPTAAAAEPPAAVAARRLRAAAEPDRPMEGESHIFSRDGVEYLTYESEEAFDDLQNLLAADAALPLAPGELQMRYFRSATDGSVQIYGLWIPPDFDPTHPYNLLVQLHGIGPKELAGRRQTWRGQGVDTWIAPRPPSSSTPTAAATRSTKASAKPTCSRPSPTPNVACASPTTASFSWATRWAAPGRG